MNNLLTVSPSPHIRSKRSTQSIMFTVLVALLPACLASVYFFGWRAISVLLVSNIVCALLEHVCCTLRKQKSTVRDLSCFVTGTLFALTLPANFGELKNLWMVFLGAFVAIVIVKEFFGGIGGNFANPAITARIVLFICFPDAMTAVVPTRISPELTAGATPLALLKADKELPSLMNMFIGNHSGAIGETCALALIIGGIILVATKVISWHIPVAFVGSVAVLTFLTDGFSASVAAFHVLAGGLLIGAIFMATDYVTSPDTPWGKIIFGIGCGVITALIRVFGAYPEGVSFAILVMNILTPYIIKLTRRKAFGGIKS